MPIRLVDAGDSDQWYEQDDAIRVFFDSGVLLDQAGMSIRDAFESPATFVPVLEESLGEVAVGSDLRSPGPQYGPHAGGGIPSFLDVVVLAKDLAEVAVVAFVIGRRLREIGVRGVYVSERGIESLARRELRVHGHPEQAHRVAVGRIPSPDKPGRWVGYAAIFRLDDGRLVTQRWSLDGLLEAFTVEQDTPSG